MEQSNQGIFTYIEIILRRKWLLIVPMVGGSLLAAAVSLRMQPYYKSSTLILVEQQQVPETYVMPTDATPIEQRLSTIQHQILSRTKLEQIIKDFNLYSNSGGGGILSKASALFTRKDSTRPSQEAVIERMRDDIDIKVLGNIRRRSDGDAFSISYTGKDPVIAMQVTNRIASLFIEENLKIREEYAEGTTEFLTSEMDKAKQELESQEKALRTFKENHMGSLPEQLEANLRTLDRIQLDMQNVTNTLKNDEDRKVLLEEQLGLRPSTIEGRGSADPLVKELNDLKSNLSRLLSVYKDNYPDVIITRKRIKELEQTIAENNARTEKEEEAGAKVQVPGLNNPDIYASLIAVKSQIKALKDRERELRKQINVFEKRVEATPENEQKLADIRRDYDISLQNYKSLLGKKLNSKLAENLEKRQKGERFRVVDPANLPEKPYKPDKAKVTLIGSVASAGVGFALVFLVEFLNPAFRKPEDFEDVINLPVLVTIPDFSMKQAGKSWTKSFKGVS